MSGQFLRLARRSLRPHRVLLHSFFAYLPLSFALGMGYDLNTSLFRGLVSFIYVNLWAVTSATINDFFDRFEDIGYKDNPFYEHDITENMGLAFTSSLLTLSFLFSFAVALAFDIRIIFFTTLGVIISWWYSDNTYIRKILGFRLKTHYGPELFAIASGYIILTASTLAINRVLILESTPLLMLVALALLRETIRKDYPQVVKDSRAGNKTFPMLYGEGKAERLIRILTYANFLALALFSTSGLLPLMTILGLTWIAGETLVLRWHLQHEIGKRMRIFLDLNPYFLLISLGLLLS